MRRTREAQRLVEEMDNLVEVVEEVRTILRAYGKLSREVARRVDDGERLAEVLEALHGPLRRQQVTDAIDALEGARHRVRLAMFAMAAAQDTSASELGRQLGISRQLASRLSSEAERTFG
jgi:hypothetical protein